VKYKPAFDACLEDKGYTDVTGWAAFPAEVTDDAAPAVAWTESQMNAAIRETDLVVDARPQARRPRWRFISLVPVCHVRGLVASEAVDVEGNEAAPPGRCPSAGLGPPLARDVQGVMKPQHRWFPIYA